MGKVPVPVDFLLGAAAICLPQYQVPVLAVSAGVKATQALLCSRHKSESSAASNGDIQNEEKGESEPPPVTLRWLDLSCSVDVKDKAKKQTSQKTILSLTAGTAQPGRLLAIIGPSGSGKTTLLNAVAGQMASSGALQLKGIVTVNGVPRASADVRQGFVAQEDVFYSQLTVRETLMMAAQLRLPKSMADSEKEEYVTELLNKLGLTKCAGTIVGDARARGVSGGEKKRLSIGCELIASPNLVFADEPTSGLDSFQAQRVMQTLKDLAEEGKTVIASIHQPRSSIFEMFDDLLLLSEGREVYFGPANEAAGFFEEQGFPCPPHYNPAEFFTDLISIDTSSPELEQESRERLDTLVKAAKERAHKLQPANGDASGDAEAVAGLASPNNSPSSSWQRQFKLLLVRSWRQATRDKATNISRAATNLGSAVIFGSIFWRMRLGQTTIQDRMGLLQVAAINTAMSSLIKTLNVFPRERTIVSAERAKKTYHVLPYFAAKLVAELPVGALFPLLFGVVVYPLTGLNPKPSRFAKFLGILTLESFVASSLGLAVGAVAPNTEAALAMGPGIMIVFIVFGGVYVNADNVPAGLRWLPNISMIKYCFEALCVNEFKGLEFESSGQPGDVSDGSQALSRVGFGNKTVPKSLIRQGRVLLFNYWACYCLLKARKPKFQKMESPREVDEEADMEGVLDASGNGSK